MTTISIAYSKQGKMKKRKYQPIFVPKMVITEPTILFRVNQRYQDHLSEEDLYRITRGEWVIGKRREYARYAFAVYKGVVLQVYKIERWSPFTGKTPSTRQRWCFDGVVAENLQHYVGSSVKHYFARGAANPVTYINC